MIFSVALLVETIFSTYWFLDYLLLVSLPQLKARRFYQVAEKEILVLLIRKENGHKFNGFHQLKHFLETIVRLDPHSGDLNVIQKHAVYTLRGITAIFHM